MTKLLKAKNELSEVTKYILDLVGLKIGKWFLYVGHQHKDQIYIGTLVLELDQLKHEVLFHLEQNHKLLFTLERKPISNEVTHKIVKKAVVG